MSISVRKVLLTVSDEKAECDGFFSATFIATQEMSFKKVCKETAIERELIAVLEYTYLAPIMDEMRKLQNSEALYSELIELIKKINRARDVFVQRHKGIFS